MRDTVAPRSLTDAPRARRVDCTFVVTKAKQKVTVPGQAGWTLLETAKHHGLLKQAPDADSDWNYSTFGEGPASAEDHVVVSREYFDKLPPPCHQEKNMLNEDLENLTPTCASLPAYLPLAMLRVCVIALS